MEAFFDNKANVLNANLRTMHDNSVLYSIKTDETAWSKSYTFVRDMNPPLGGQLVNVGTINWNKKTLEVNGHRKTLGEIRKKAKGFRNKSRFWKWSPEREEYDIVHHEDGWQALCTSTGVVEATFSVPYRPQLFGKTKPVVISLSRHALAKDEVFLILVFIYCEYKRQEAMFDRTVPGVFKAQVMVSAAGDPVKEIFEVKHNIPQNIRSSPPAQMKNRSVSTE